MHARILLVATSIAAAGCAHQPINISTLTGLAKPAIVGRIEAEAGPVSTVFRDEPAFAPRLTELKIDAAEGDRRLSGKLANGTKEASSITRFEVADSIRATVRAQVPNVAPYSKAADPTAVATTLESFLIDERTTAGPNYERLRGIGVDSILEITVESYGMRAEKGKAGCFVVGNARFFKMDGGTFYTRRFFSDELSAGFPGVDPFAVAKNPAIFREHLKPLLEAIGTQIAQDVSTPGEAVANAPPASGGDVAKPAKGTQQDQPNNDAL